MAETEPTPAPAPSPYDRLLAEQKTLRARLEQIAKGARDVLGNLKGRMRNVESRLDGLERQHADLLRVLFEHSGGVLRAERLADTCLRDVQDTARRVHDLETMICDPVPPPPHPENNGEGDIETAPAPAAD